MQPGQVISGRFRLERLLGQGGMGTVWEARHLSLETQIAIKFLNSELSRRHDVLARFAREATSAARINSPHVVSILDSGFTDDGRGFIAMELLRGEDLGRRLARVGTLTPSETALLVTQVARGLAKAHAVGVVHRDLKPENIFVVDEDDTFTVKILDFGIAKSIGPEGATHKTDTGQILGTPLYMSPEQALGRPLDSRSDLYSLSVVAYRCLAGRPPFTYNATGELIVAVSTHAAPPPSDFNSDLSAEVDAWFVGALAKDPGARSCQKASELGDSFGRVCGGATSPLSPSSDAPRVNLRPSRPPMGRSDTEQTPVPSAEEVATTVVAAQMPLASSVRERQSRWRTIALFAALLLAAASAASRLRGTSAESGAQAVLPPPQSQALSRTLDPALPATSKETPAPATTASSSATPEPRPPARPPSAPRSPAPAPLSTVNLETVTDPIPPVIAPAENEHSDVTRKKAVPTLDRDDPWHQADGGS